MVGSAGPEPRRGRGARDARALVNDDDHADIRGLVTAARSRITLIGVLASRDPCVVGSMVTHVTLYRPKCPWITDGPRGPAQN
jgi:hypothetical protein